MVSTESWIVLFVFIVNLIFMLIMSFVSAYYKQFNTKGLCKWFNIAMLGLVIVVGGIFMIYNVQCTITGDCQMLAGIITCLLVAFTAFNIGWSVYKTVTFKVATPTPVIQETSPVLAPAPVHTHAPVTAE